MGEKMWGMSLRFSSSGGAGIGCRRCGEEGGVSHPVFSLGWSGRNGERKFVPFRICVGKRCFWGELGGVFVSRQVAVLG